LNPVTLSSPEVEGRKFRKAETREQMQTRREEPQLNEYRKLGRV
jgi:hypothetical protein